MNIRLVAMDADPFDAPGNGPGDGGRYLVDGLARALGVAGHRVTVYTRRREAAQPARVEIAPNVTLVSLDAGESLDAWRNDPPQAVHAFGWESGKLALSAGEYDGVPVVLTCYPIPLPGQRRGDGSDERTAIVRRAARIIATSSSDVFSLMGIGALPGAIKFVPGGVDLVAFAPAIRPPRDVREPFRIATLSGLEPAQGVADVIEAVASLAGVELHIGGGGQADALRLASLVRARGLGDRVRFAGPVARAAVAAFLGAADVFVCTPHVRAGGSAVLEAMACGVPAIVSSVGGLVDAVADGLTGLHVPPRAPRQIAYAVTALRDDRVRCERFGRFGRERAVARYGWDRIAAQTYEIYRSVAVRAPVLTRSEA